MGVYACAQEFAVASRRPPCAQAAGLRWCHFARYQSLCGPGCATRGHRQAAQGQAETNTQEEGAMQKDSSAFVLCGAKVVSKHINVHMYVYTHTKETKYVLMCLCTHVSTYMCGYAYTWPLHSGDTDTHRTRFILVLAIENNIMVAVLSLQCML